MSKNTNQRSERISKGFDLIAAWYDLLLKLPPGKSILYSQHYFINQLPYSEKVLIIGEGTGNFLKEFLLSKKAGCIWVVESSQKMVAKAEKKIRKLPESDKERVSFVITGFQNFQMEEKFDLVITNFFLDQFTEETVKSMGSQIRQLLRPEGIWYFTDFCSESSNSGNRLINQAYIKFLYFCFRKVTGIEATSLPDFPKIFNLLKMQEIDSKWFAGSLIKTILMKPKHI